MTPTYVKGICAFLHQAKWLHRPLGLFYNAALAERQHLTTTLIYVPNNGLLYLIYIFDNTVGLLYLLMQISGCVFSLVERLCSVSSSVQMATLATEHLLYWALKLRFMPHL